MGNCRFLIRLELDETLLNARTPASASIVGAELAEQVAAFQRRCRLGYFPPLLYCARMGGIDAELLQTFDGLHWLTVQLSRREVLRRLRALHDEVRLRAVSNLAYTLAKVRPRDRNALATLGAHLAPNRLRLELTGPDCDSVGDPAHLMARVHDELADAFLQVDVLVYADQPEGGARIHAVPT